LVKQTFNELPYVSLENMDTRQFALDDPRGFLQTYVNGAIFDGIQRTPQLFSYLQEFLDNTNKKGRFILTGSNNFLLQQSITQSLAGRVGYLTLLPFSLKELASINALPVSDLSLMKNGFYPPIYDQQIPPNDWCPNYIKTYIERDVRQIKNISDLIVFERFMKILAARTGQEFNASALALDTGVDVKTIQSWIGILESSYIIYLLKPHYKNFNKTIVKRPKIYFYDTALVCSLIGILNEEQLDLNPAKGAIFENMVINEFVKNCTNQGVEINLFYWRDKTGHEIDLIIDEYPELLPIEIKSGKTINTEFFKNLIFWMRISGLSKAQLLYGGNQSQKYSSGIEVKNWRFLNN
jgi:predicted AAA+ superfamily ATPase